MKLGLSSYTYGWAVGVRGHEPAKRADEFDLLGQVHAHELRLLQIADNLPLECFSPDRLSALGGRAQFRNVELEVGARGLTPERLDLYAGIARKLGATLIRFVIDDSTCDYHPKIDAIVSLVRENLAALDGLLLGIENHDRFTAAEFHHIIDSIDAPNVGICLDTANSLGAGEGLETVVAALAPLTLNLHIKDFRVKRLPHMMGFSVTGCPAGTGLVNVPRLLEKLRAHGRCRSAILEQWTLPEDTIERTVANERAWADASINYLRPFFK